MRKYHIADVLSALEILFAIGLMVMSALGVAPEYALAAFVLGELCDAFDGIAARRWHYPNDGKIRWWRLYAPEIDQLGDVLLGAGCAAYLIFRVDSHWGTILVGTVVTVSILVTLWNQYTLSTYEDPDTPYIRMGPAISTPEIERLNRRRTVVLLGRRYLYVVGIGIAIIMLIFATSWTTAVKLTLVAIGAVLGLLLAIVKWNRLTQVKTPL